MQLAGGTRSGGIHSFPSVGRLRSSRIPWRSSAQPAHTRWRGIGDSAQAAPVRCDAEQRRAESVRGATAELAEAPLAAPASSVRRQPSDGTGRRRPHGGASHHSLLAWPRPTLLARGATAIWRGPPPREATAATGGSLPLAAFPLDSCKIGRGLPCGESPPGQSGARRLSSRRPTAGAPAVSRRTGRLNTNCSRHEVDRGNRAVEATAPTEEDRGQE